MFQPKFPRNVCLFLIDLGLITAFVGLGLKIYFRDSLNEIVEKVITSDSMSVKHVSGNKCWNSPLLVVPSNIESLNERWFLWEENLKQCLLYALQSDESRVWFLLIFFSSEWAALWSIYWWQAVWYLALGRVSLPAAWAPFSNPAAFMSQPSKSTRTLTSMQAPFPPMSMVHLKPLCTYKSLFEVIL